MSHETINKSTYESPNIVSLYCSGPIQCAELRILVTYKDDYWGRRALDIGVGAGRTTEVMRTLNVDYTAVDYSELMIRQCGTRFPDARCMHCDARDMSCFDDRSFDFVMFSNNGLDCLVHDDRMRALREINRVLGGDGLFVFSTHNRDYSHARSNPRLTLSLDPFRQARFLYRHMRRWSNHRQNRRHERFEETYWILNDRSHLYSLLTYYIGVPDMVRQLSDVGFEAIEVLGRDGLPLALDAPDNGSSWIYYVARKRRPPA